MITKNSRPGNRNVFFVGLLSFFGGISQDVFSPILPVYLTDVLGFSKSFVGVAEGIVAASVNIFKIIAGFFSDKFKKQRPIVFAGYFLSMLSRPLLAFVYSGAGILGLRLLDGAGKGIKDPPKDVLVAGSAKKETRGKSFGIARMLDTLGSVAGPLILFLLLNFLKDGGRLYKQILLFTALPLVITLILIFTKIKEVYEKEVKESKPPAAANTNGMPKSFYLFLAVALVFALGNSSDAFLILRARNLGLAVETIPLVIAIFNLVYALAAVPLGSLSDKIGRMPTLVMGWCAYALVYLGFAFAKETVFIWPLYAFYGIYYATSEGVSRAFLSDIVPADHRGRAFGIYGTSVGVASLGASFLAGILWDRFGPQSTFYFSAAMAGFAAFLLFVLSGKIKKAIEAAGF